jgi:hypothetical protein
MGRRSKIRIEGEQTRFFDKGAGNADADQWQPGWAGTTTDNSS